MHINLPTSIALSSLVDATVKSQLITILEDNGALSVGTLRHFVKSPQDIGFITSDDNLLDAYVRVTMRSGLERFVNVLEVCQKIEQGTIAVNFDGGS